MKKILILLSFVFYCGVLFAQQRTVSGVVKDDSSGLPLPGVTVVVKGTTQGTITEANGNYSLVNVPGKATLVFSFVGMKTQEISVEGKNTINVQLQEDAIGISEVVAIGYASKSKTNLVGAVQSVSIADAEMRTVTSADVLLQGKVAGLQLTQNSGQPGYDEMEIRLRGVSSISNNSSPLVIIDGVESEINAVNPHDIESISVLKDAASAAIYGNRAAGGVIIIQTKQGKSDVKVTYTGSTSVQFPTFLPDVVEDPVLYIDITNEACDYSKIKHKYTDAQRELWLNQESEMYVPTNWKDVIYDNGIMQAHHVSMTGGGDRFGFAFLAGYKDQDGVVYSTKGDKFDYRLKANGKFLNKMLDVGAIISGYDQNSHEAQSSNTIITRYISNRPTLFLKSTKTGRTIYGGGAPFMAIEELGGGIDINNKELSTTFNAVLNPLRGLEFAVMYNKTQDTKDTQNYTPEYEVASSIESTTGSVKQSLLSLKNYEFYRTTFNVNGKYEFDISKHHFDVLTGYEVREISSNANTTSVSDLTINIPLLSYGDPNKISVSSNSYELAHISYFGRLSYDFNHRYLLEVNGRYDGSSRFAPGHRFGFFPSAALAWRISEENWLKEINWVDNLKLRLSAGRLGNENISSRYAYIDEMSADTYYSFGGTQTSSGAAITKLSNAATSWETIEQVNIGLDLDFLKKFTLSIDLFNKDSKGMLGSVYPALSLGTGLTTVAQNVGDMRNRGIEVTAGYIKKFTNGLNINVGGNIAYIENKVLNLGTNTEQWHTTDGMIRSVVGYPFESVYGYNCLGVYQVSDFTWQNNSDPSIADIDRNYVLKDGVTATTLHSNIRPGDLLLEDRNNDHTITEDDITRLGKGLSNLSFALNFSASWKNFDISILGHGQGSALAYLQNFPLSVNAFTGQITTNFITERWTEETPQYRCTFADKSRINIVSSYDMHNAAFFRIKNMQLGYTFKDAFLSKYNIKNIRVYASGENLFTITNFADGFDPERAITNYTVRAYPLISSISGGLIVNF